MARRLPSAMRAAAANRTDAALKRLFEAMAAAEDGAKAASYGVQKLTLKSICEAAAVGEKFLFGDKHKGTTKTEIEGRIGKLNRLIEARAATAAAVEGEEAPLEKAEAEARYWKERYERLAYHGNLWFVRMRQQQRIIRDLREGTHSINLKRD